MRSIFVVGLLTFGLFAATPADASEQCPAAASTVQGKGLVNRGYCWTYPAPTPDHTDAYYTVAVLVTPGPGFGSATFAKSSLQATILRSFAKAVFNYDKATSVNLRYEIDVGQFKYPVTTVLSFKRNDKDQWKSTIEVNPQNLEQKLTALDKFKVTLQVDYTKQTRAELTPAVDLAGQLGLNLATPAAKPIVTAANDLVAKVLQANDVAVASSATVNLGTGNQEMSGAKYDVVDPLSGSVIATIDFRILGTRSIISTPQPLGALETTMPTALVSQVKINSLPAELATGDAKNWSIIGSAVASTSSPQSAASLGDVLGKNPTAENLLKFCGSLETGLDDSYKLTSIDNLLVRATVLQAATQNVRARLNPYRTCFPDDHQRKLVHDLLGFDTEYKVVVAQNAKPLTDDGAFATLGCFITGQTGDYCGGGVDQAVQNLFADQVTVPALEVTNAAIGAGLPPSGAISRDDFLSRLKGKFAHFRDFRAKSGSMIVQETEGGPALRLTAEVDARGKITKLQIRRT